MTKKTWYDSAKNVLHINKVPDSIKPKIEPLVDIVSEAVNNESKSSISPFKAELRGFIITVVDSQDEVTKVQAGQTEIIKLFPVLAPDEQTAINVASQHGKIPLTITAYEYIKFQVELLENLARQESIKLLNTNNVKAEFQTLQTIE